MEEGRDLCQSTTTSELEPSAMIVEYPSSDDADKEGETRLSKTEAFPGSIFILAHACQCGDESCSLPECQLTKRILSHAETCKPEISGSCITCKQLFDLSSQHAKECQETRCPVPFCLEYKQKMAQQCEDELEYCCNHCKKYVKTRYHCTVCDDFDLCTRCFNKDGHIHKMQRLGFELGDDSAGGDQKQSNPQVSRKVDIHRCIISLEHACHCRDVNCCLLSCKKMKRVVAHSKTCKKKCTSYCAICKQLISLSCYHAKICQKTKCLVPYCSHIKYKLKQQEKQEIALHQQRMAQQQQLVQPMELRPQSQMIGATKMPNTACPVPGGAKPSQVMSNAGTSTSVSMQKRSNTQVLQQLLTSLKSSNFQQKKQQVLHILKSNPQLMAAFLKQRSGQQQQQVMNERVMIGQPQQQVINEQAIE